MSIDYELRLLRQAVEDYDEHGMGADLSGRTAEAIRWALAEIDELRFKSAIANKSLSIMANRNWTVKHWANGKWGVVEMYGGCPHGLMPCQDNRRDDPFIAIIEADIWLKENVENKQPSN